MDQVPGYEVTYLGAGCSMQGCSFDRPRVEIVVLAKDVCRQLPLMAATRVFDTAAGSVARLVLVGSWRAA